MNWRLPTALLLVAFPVRAQRATSAAAPVSATTPRMYTGLKTKQHAKTAPGKQSLVTDYPTVFAVEKGSPAERAGFRVGDVLIAVNGFDPMTARARATLRGPGLPNAIRVRRGVTELTLTLTPTTPKPPATGKR